MKKWYTSKTLWINAVAIVGIILSGQFGIELESDTITIIMSGINIILRTITKEPVVW